MDHVGLAGLVQGWSVVPLERFHDREMLRLGIVIVDNAGSGVEPAHVQVKIEAGKGRG